MKYNIYNKKTNFIESLFTILLWGIAIAFVVFIIEINIYILAKYGGKPIDEVPSWVLWFWFGGRK